ncbi:long-chain-fatty-acid-CoA-ligase [Mycena olivaceomarginata]|nr:long-chain-fatty-acid-CoA-ligase [Mycena olivaceomarginata]
MTTPPSKISTHTSKPGYFGAGSVPVAPPAADNEGPTRRLAISADALVKRPFEGIETVWDVVEYVAKTHGTRDALGWRDVVKVHEEEKEIKKKDKDGKDIIEKKKWKYFELSDYRYISYVGLKEAIEEVARGLVDIGVGKDDVFNIYAATSINWQLLAHACGSISTRIATAYDTLGPAGLTHSLNEPECAALFTNAALLPTLLSVLPNTPTVKYIGYDGEPDKGVVDKLHAVRADITALSVDELRERGKKAGEEVREKVQGRRPTPETVSCIMGVVITHANLIASVRSAPSTPSLGTTSPPEDAYLAYLPLAHILEYIVELIMLFVGMPTGFGGVKTLTDASVRNCDGDIKAFRPSIMVGVPAVWETIRKGHHRQGHCGRTRKGERCSGARGTPVLGKLADSVVLSAVRAATGGRLRIAMSGGAAISRETQEFLSVALVMLLQGYGMTESCGMCAIMPPECFRYDTVGLPVPSIEIKVRFVFLPVSFLGLLSPAGETAATEERGEVCIRGPSVISGYFKRPDLNEDPTIFAGIKNLVKLAGGEYIALEQLESTYKACNYVANICVHATPEAKAPIAIIIPHEQNLRAALKSGSASTAPSPTTRALCTDPRVAALVLKECNAVGKKSGFKAMETLSAVVLTPEEWTPESGLVTAAQKIQRSAIAKKFDREIKEAYKNQ